MLETIVMTSLLFRDKYAQETSNLAQSPDAEFDQAATVKLTARFSH